MKNLKDIEFLLQEINLYYMMTRQAGHTYIALNGIKSNPNAKIVVINHKHAKDLKLSKDKYYTLDQIKNARTMALHGQTPILFDNYTIIYLIDNILMAISHSNGEIDKLKNMNSQLVDENKKLITKIIMLEDALKHYQKESNE